MKVVHEVLVSSAAQHMTKHVAEGDIVYNQVVYMHFGSGSTVHTSMSQNPDMVCIMVHNGRASPHQYERGTYWMASE